MATLRERRGKWYARIQWRSSIGKMMEKSIPLRTDSKVAALVRLGSVNKVEDDIKDGIKFSFPWQNDERVNKVVRYELSSSINEYLAYLSCNGAKPTTVERAQYCLNNLKNVLGEKYPIETISTTQIERFKAYYKGRLTDNGININLTRIRAFVNWLADTKGILTIAPKVQLIKVPKHPPRYLTETDVSSILKLDWLDGHYKDVFRVYWETGARLRELFNGEIDGRWLVVDAEDSKSGIPREVLLQQHHIPVVIEMHRRCHKTKAQFNTFTLYYSKMFKKTAIAIGREDLHFHNLRDTYAIMRYLETRDIYQVSKELGHSSVKVTEKYTHFRLRRLEEDFPSIGQYANNKKKGNIPLKDTKMKDTNHRILLYSEEK
ncbi:MAG: tyrosine-type recombinase/integrase [Candidatus Marinimicrobia bacterium]|jgi:integrase|nr:tyrosine-type recombinase/integrase [Candidatus Neomarinimicrobiota bacterium]MDP6568400.1 tyrosine-type recombinase/integrase [Candidatus Neomarinimicrobiota bacterium]MDP7026163.1 tyrosine-type recombinase/integrase [Candidatus Neomarinimicrobiota bacterium]MDP7653229.1 tyrosine-type recombinase/integrase [Candidatus Neomarinimicrobiota bacterium]|tara:strand:+ start:225 stop:1352 length:1128 start_codon:yes stop_codon:yes gene_type:complete